MKPCSNVCNWCHPVRLKFYWNWISFAVVIAKCLGGSLFRTHCSSVMQWMVVEVVRAGRGWSIWQLCWTDRRRRRHIVHRTTAGRPGSIRDVVRGLSQSSFAEDQTSWRDHATHWRRTSNGSTVHTLQCCIVKPTSTQHTQWYILA